METNNENNPAIRENTGRNEDGTFMKGVSGNPTGRPKGTMKDYLRRKMIDMADSEKEDFLKTVSHEIQIRLAEGNPDTKTDITSDGKAIGNLTSSELALAKELESKLGKLEDGTATEEKENA